ncbi:MAG TPA: acyl-CoA thioesterase [Candidatus Poseidoniales archaeon]|jgi:YbgC/YbaW family acyl-CoA thioester hydrolase|nr:acyl-CoA thioesterase [Candidatus Poseidoniales archaeon]
MAIELSRRVDFPMVDMAKVVYYPEYFDLAHRFFEESWDEICGINYATLTQEMHVGFPAVRTEANHVAPLRYGDVITCKMWIESVGDTSVTWRYQFSNADGLCWDATVVTVCCDLRTFAKQTVPAELAAALRNCSED